MAIHKATGVKAKCDKLFSRIIRYSGECENCDYRCGPLCKPHEGSHRAAPVCKLQCAHLITRHLSATRCEVRNAFSLCAKCHYHFGLWPLEFAKFVLDRRTQEEYDDLRQRAQYKGRPMSWEMEYERLEQLWRELGEQWDF